jgi:hypothetical protein
MMTPETAPETESSVAVAVQAATMIVTDVETRVEAAATDTAGIAQSKVLITDVIEMMAAAIAEDDRATAQGLGADQDLQIPSDGGTQNRSRHLPQSHAVRYHHKTINSVAK